MKEHFNKLAFIICVILTIFLILAYRWIDAQTNKKMGKHRSRSQQKASKAKQKDGQLTKAEKEAKRIAKEERKKAKRAAQRKERVVRNLAVIEEKGVFEKCQGVKRRDLSRFSGKNLTYEHTEEQSNSEVSNK